MNTRFRLIATTLALALCACTVSVDGEGEQPTPPIEAPNDPCELVRLWCHTPFVWDEDPTGRCYCACTAHEICSAAPTPVESRCGLLLTLKNPDQIMDLESPYKQFFPYGFPFVCRIDEDEVPDSPLPQ